MRRAIALAIENVSTGPRRPVWRGGGAGEVTAEASNRVTPTNDPRAHAEIVAVREACRAIANFQLVGCGSTPVASPAPCALGSSIGRVRTKSFTGLPPRTRRPSASTTPSFTDELRIVPRSARSIPMNQMLRDDCPGRVPHLAPKTRKRRTERRAPMGNSTQSRLGQSIPRKEGRDKVTGRARYVDDSTFRDASRRDRAQHGGARAHPRDSFRRRDSWDEFTVVTAKDIPGENCVALIDCDQPCLADDFVNHPEEAGPFAGAPRPVFVEDARRAVRIEIDPLPPFHNRGIACRKK